MCFIHVRVNATKTSDVQCFLNAYLMQGGVGSSSRDLKGLCQANVLDLDLYVLLSLVIVIVRWVLICMQMIDS